MANKEVKGLVRSLREAGFGVILAPNGHYRVTAPDGRKAQIAATPRHHRTMKNDVTRLRRIGYQPPSKHHHRRGATA